MPNSARRSAATPALSDVPATRRSLAADFAALGLARGDAVLTHAALRKVGPVLGGPDAIIAAIMDVIGPEGTLLGYTDWQYEDDARASPALRDDIGHSRIGWAQLASGRPRQHFPALARALPALLRAVRRGWFDRCDVLPPHPPPGHGCIDTEMSSMSTPFGMRTKPRLANDGKVGGE